MTRFFNPEELRALNALRRTHLRRRAPARADTTELAGEIVAVDLPDETDSGSGGGGR
jgi:hypothetical protein